MGLGNNITEEHQPHGAHICIPAVSIIKYRLSCNDFSITGQEQAFTERSLRKKYQKI
ncbi:hypothetical protein SAMN05216311_101753 [Chitinophaga sp. CF418]|nr:hypothetical protein SAMN05216311_101753 [Chitinophaga sp. CF418]